MPDAARVNPELILPVGTQVVAMTEVRGADGVVIHPRRAVGVVAQSPVDACHSYRVRFLDGVESSFRRHDLVVLSAFKNGEMGEAAIGGHGAMAASDLHRHVIYRCIVGSRAFGLDDADSDTDRRGIYLPPAELHWSLYGVPEQLDDPANEEVYWEAQKFVTLALKANPNILECLYTPLVEHATPLAQELLAMRDLFLSRLVYQTYNGYVTSQFKKLQADTRNNGQVKWKHVMHLLRLLIAGIEVLNEGRVPVRVGEARERLISVKRGEMTFDDCEAWRVRLHQQFDRAYETTALPERPDYAAANDWLLRARRSMIE